MSSEAEVEAVARALCRQAGKNPDHCPETYGVVIRGSGGGHRHSELLPSFPQWMEYRDAARAALAATSGAKDDAAQGWASATFYAD